MMNTLVTLISVAALVAASPSGGSKRLNARSDYCGTDQFGADWYCYDSSTECCIGSVLGSCMPTGYTCCDTGYYCTPDEDCVIDTVTLIQYCVPSGSGDSADSSDSTEAVSGGADSSSSGSDSSGGSGGSGSGSDTGDEEDAAPRLLLSSWAMVGVVGAVVALL